MDRTIEGILLPLHQSLWRAAAPGGSPFPPGLRAHSLSRPDPPFPMHKTLVAEQAHKPEIALPEGRSAHPHTRDRQHTPLSLSLCLPSRHT